MGPKNDFTLLQEPVHDICSMFHNKKFNLDKCVSAILFTNYANWFFPWKHSPDTAETGGKYLNPELKEWLDKNTPEYDYAIDHFGTGIITFAKRQDALLFKLTWN